MIHKLTPAQLFLLVGIVTPGLTIVGVRFMGSGASAAHAALAFCMCQIVFSKKGVRRYLSTLPAPSFSTRLNTGQQAMLNVLRTGNFPMPYCLALARQRNTR